MLFALAILLPGVIFLLFAEGDDAVFRFKLGSEFEELIARFLGSLRGLRSLHGIERIGCEGCIVLHSMDVQGKLLPLNFSIGMAIFASARFGGSPEGV